MKEKIPIGRIGSNICLADGAIGVIYRPDTERYSHYFDAKVAQQFDSVIHFDETRSLTAVEAVSEHEEAELPDAYPSGI